MTDKALWYVHECGLAVDKGEQRKNNEDSAVSIGIGLAESGLDQAIGVYAVADGMGGHARGEVASQTAIHTAVREVIRSVTARKPLTDARCHEALNHAVRVANHVIYDQNDKSTGYEEMGTTLVLALVIDNCVHIASVGDSRAYLISPNMIQQVTTDHTLTQMLIQRGVITRKQALIHPYRNVLNKAIGMEADVSADLFKVELPEDGALLLCSDGLTNELADRRIHQIVQRSNSPQTACDALIEAANRAGGRDNISALLIQARSQPEHTVAVPLPEMV